MDSEEQDEQQARQDEMAEADICAEEAAGKPLAYNPGEGIAVMEKRIAYLQRRTKALDVSDVHEGPRKAELLADLRRQLVSARERLAEYQVQQTGRN